MTDPLFPISFSDYFSKGYDRSTSHCQLEQASVAQLDAPPTGDREVAGLTPVESATFFL